VWVKLPTVASQPSQPTPTLSFQVTEAPILATPATVIGTLLPTAEQASETANESLPIPTTALVPPDTPAPLFVTRESNVTPQAEATLSITAISTDISADFLPVNPGTAFELGAPRVYVFFDFEGMSDGVSWSGVVLVNRQQVDEGSFDQLWSMGEEGIGMYRWFDRDGGWPVGEYEVRFYIGDKLADSATFRVVEGLPASGDPTVEATP
jgi:hypothetical protein